MIIPLRTNYRLRKTPWVNYAIIAANVLLYTLGYSASTTEHQMRITAWMLQPDTPMIEQFFSCMFLHAGLIHLLGNMVFLWVFGNAINDKFGHAGYLAFYLAGGVLAGIGYLLLAGTAPVLGASGAIAAVAGAYLVLLPATNVTLLVWLLYLLLPVDVSSLYFILFQFLFDSYMTLSSKITPGSGGVAYAAHATGYAFGILVAAGMLAAKLLPRDDFDLLHMLKAWRRRAEYRRMARGGFDPFSPTTPPPGMRNVEVKTVEIAPAKSASAEELQLRKDISAACGDHNLPEAARLYLQLEPIAENPVLSQQQQLDVANQLMATKSYAAAGRAYERFIEHFPRYEFLGDIHLMLGLLHSRYLRQYDQATASLTRALELLDDPAKKAMADDELANVRKHLKS
ncbi:MAG: rhomboid family intramembrane serine protease [Phycisphaerae bacterium]|nr:rhomboid family intramembrane serine protease [Phycisphaerae bacterium]